MSSICTLYKATVRNSFVWTFQSCDLFTTKIIRNLRKEAQATILKHIKDERNYSGVLETLQTPFARGTLMEQDKKEETVADTLVKQLEAFRKEINVVDQDLLQLLKERLRIAQEIGRIKR